MIFTVLENIKNLGPFFVLHWALVFSDYKARHVVTTRRSLARIGILAVSACFLHQENSYIMVIYRWYPVISIQVLKILVSSSSALSFR